MYFLIDYENVKNLGMRGSEYLLPSDHIIIFYSSSTPMMEQRHLNNIQNSGCGFEICELLTKRKNGLDFYMATKVGELFGAGRCKNAVLISNDTGFQAVRDFWQERSGTKHRVALSESIERGIITVGENSERARLIRSGQRAISIQVFFVISSYTCRSSDIYCLIPPDISLPAALLWQTLSIPDNSYIEILLLLSNPLCAMPAFA